MKSAKIQHPLESFGVVTVTRGDIRAEPLEERIKPRVPFPHKHDFYHLVLVLRGSGWHQIDFQKHAVKRGHLFVMKPGQVHAWEMKSGVAGFVLEFTAESLAESAAAGPGLLAEASQELPDLIKLDDGATKTLAALCEAMHEEFKNRSLAYQQSLRSYLSVFLIQLLRREARHWPPRERIDRLTDRFRGLVEQHHRREHAVEFYAEALGLTAKALTMRTSRALGRSARQVIHERLLLEARRLLLYSDLSVSAVGQELGYEDANYFIRFFRQHSGVTPAKFRERLKKNL